MPLFGGVAPCPCIPGRHLGFDALPPPPLPAAGSAFTSAFTFLPGEDLLGDAASAAAAASAATTAVEDALRVRLASIAPHHRGSHVSQSHELPTRLRTTRARERNRDRGNGDDATGPSAWACILCCEWNAEVS